MDKNNNIYSLYDPEKFHDSCGIGFIVARSGKPEKRILPLALKALKRLSHRGAKSYDRKSGDGSGILIDLPKLFFKRLLRNEFNKSIPRREVLAVAMVFTTVHERKWLEEIFSAYVKKSGFKLLAVRNVPTEKKSLGDLASKTKPLILQFIVSAQKVRKRNIETRLYLLRKILEKQILNKRKRSYICSFSSKTIVYKGLMASAQLDQFYLDLHQKDFIVKMVLFHERFSTNTGSTWAMAQPFQMIAHNGEFNTIKGNRLWMKARENEISSKFWGSDLDNLKPITEYVGSDSKNFDNVLEFLVRSGRDIFDSVMIMIPDSYSQNSKYYQNRTMNKKMHNYFVYHENFIEPWDGPAALVYTEGEFVGAKMDRNGLRPLRYTITKDGLVIMASEAGIIDVDDDNLVLHHHMKSEEIFGVSLSDGAIMKNKEIKIREASKKPYG
ncbi:MAG: glutamate synthase subunit alpha, partial [Candidatus Neomarinimicrobiota bacterium]|nr:glutamate synthase subunit alpha [Candidatus Neomarinimicrobiota bacterium]